MTPPPGVQAWSLSEKKKKKTGVVRIYVDLKPLNKSVLREVHPIPRVDETLAQLSGAAVFSKLDANSEFCYCKNHARLPPHSDAIASINSRLAF